MHSSYSAAEQAAIPNLPSPAALEKLVDLHRSGVAGEVAPHSPKPAPSLTSQIMLPPQGDTPVRPVAVVATRPANDIPPVEGVGSTNAQYDGGDEEGTVKADAQMPEANGSAGSAVGAGDNVEHVDQFGSRTPIAGDHAAAE